MIPGYTIIIAIANLIHCIHCPDNAWMPYFLQGNGPSQHQLALSARLLNNRDDYNIMRIP